MLALPYVPYIRSTFETPCERAFQSIEPVQLWQFIVATICVWPKIFLSVFIGSKIALLADGKHRQEMDLRKAISPPAMPSALTHLIATTILNIFFIAIGLLMGAAAAWSVQ